MANGNKKLKKGCNAFAIRGYFAYFVRIRGKRDNDNSKSNLLRKRNISLETKNNKKASEID